MLHDRILSRVRARGPLTFADFMDIALYDPLDGYYTRAPQRSGKRGDFYTSVDVSPLFGALIAEQVAEMWTLVRTGDDPSFHLVEAGAGNGRLSRDVLDALQLNHPDVYRHIRVTLVERSGAGRDAQPGTLGPHAERLAASTDRMPEGIRGAVIANELLDALPAHVVEMTDAGLVEVFVGEREGLLVEVPGPVSDLELLADIPPLEPGERFEVSLAARRWVHETARALARGFLLIFDYAFDPSPEYLRTHPAGTLMSYRSHRATALDVLSDPGDRDLTVHVNLAALRREAAHAGLTLAGIVDQTYFLLALGLLERVATGEDRRSVRERIAARTLMMPAGLGGTMKAMIFSKQVGCPALRGLRSGRLT